MRLNIDHMAATGTINMQFLYFLSWTFFYSSAIRKCKMLTLRLVFQSQEVIDKLSTHWKEFKDHTCEELTFTSEPFRVCLLHNLLANPEIINNIVDDMNTLDWSRKKMDLYEFHQTADLASLTWQRSIRGIYELLKTEVMSWVRSI